MIKKVVFEIEGMECASCTLLIDGDLEECAGVRSARTSYAKSQAEVEFEGQVMNEAEIRKVIEKTGYKVAVLSRKRG